MPANFTPRTPIARSRDRARLRNDLRPKELKNIVEPVRVYSLEVGKPAQAKPAPGANAAVKPKLWASTSRWSSRWLAFAAITALLFVAAGGSFMLGGRIEAGAGCPSLDRGASAHKSLRRGA